MNPERRRMIRFSRLLCRFASGAGSATLQVAAACCLLAAGAFGQAAVGLKAPITRVSPEQFQAHVRDLRGVVDACRTAAVNCDPAKVGEDNAVDAQHFQMRWIWLRNTLTQAKEARPAEREALLKGANDRLDEIANGGPPPAGGSFATARKAADNILSGAEFGTVEHQSWWSRQWARFWLWWGRIWERAANLGSVGPWIGRALEVLLFGGAAVGLLFFVRRSLLRQRLAVALNNGGGELMWKRESNDWASQAEASARAGDWRDAVHCLYWATIVMLEGRRAWRHNPARTPREYVRLLKPGSPQHGALRGLTQIFERLWYGLREAAPSDYEKARGLYENLRDNTAVEGAA
jgi:Domain of unknown function (DUF4129)